MPATRDRSRREDDQMPQKMTDRSVGPSKLIEANSATLKLHTIAISKAVAADERVGLYVLNTEQDIFPVWLVARTTRVSY